MALGLFVGLGLATAAGVAAAKTAPWRVMNPKAYQSFVRNWSPADTPLCAVISSEAQWDQVMHPAPVMGANKPYRPAPGFWTDHAVLLVSQVMSQPDNDAYGDVHLARHKQTTQVSFRLKPPPVGSSSFKVSLMIAAAKPVAPTVVFLEDGKVLCRLQPGAGAWVTPKPAP